MSGSRNKREPLVIFLTRRSKRSNWWRGQSGAGAIRSPHACRLLLKGQTMAALFRKLAAAGTLACGLTATVTLVSPGPAAADDSDHTQSEETAPCIVGHRFEPGPIVDGHYRQPTPAEFDARMRELRAMSQRSAGSCSAPPLSPTGADVALGTRPISAPPNPKR
jgi:hypothetical protein